MGFRTVRSSFLILAVFGFFLQPIRTTASNARIIRLSIVQGDVRILHDSKGDPLANDKANWSRAELNLPIHQHDVLATDAGRAEVEFENGAMAFINENTVLEFFDLSLDDGSLSTRLILRQGTASFYVNPSNADYFSVTGGDFTTEAAGRTNFRMENFDDGSTVAVNKGRVTVLHKNDNTILVKGQSLTMHAGDNISASVARAPESDEFDRWVSGREDSVVTATNSALQYSNNSSYVSGFGDLYTYGGFYPISGFGYGWQPYGVGLGWSPFAYGNWFYGPGIGWSFIGSQPWGWLPYHYGGWLFEPGIGWLWTPTGFGRGSSPVRFHPVTATFVTSGNTVAVVPVHPLDNHGKLPVNLAQGVMPITSRSAVSESELANGAKWKVVKDPPREALVSHSSSSPAPARVTRTLNTSPVVTAGASPRAASSIVYDAKEHRFVNSNVGTSAKANTTSEASAGVAHRSGTLRESVAATARATNSTEPARVLSARSASSRTAAPPPAARTNVSSGGAFSGAVYSRGATTQTGTTARSSAPSRGSSGGSSRSH